MPATPGCRRARTCSTASASCCCSATSAADLSLVYHGRTVVDAGQHRRLHQSMQGRARHARPTSMPSSPRSGACSRRASATSTPPAIDSTRRATSRRCAACAAPTRRASQRARGGRAARPRVQARRRQSATPTARRAGPSPATAGRARGTGSRRTTTRASMPSPRPTSVDGAALEVLRLTELARVYRAYEDRAAPTRGALDYGEQIAARRPAVQDPAQRPAPLPAPDPLPARRRVPGRQRRPDRAHRAAGSDARPAGQRHGRGRRRPEHLSIPGRELRRLRRVRARFAQPPAHDPTRRRPVPLPRLRLEQNFRSGGHVLTGANRLIASNATRFEPDKRLRTDARRRTSRSQIVVCGSAGRRGGRHRRAHQGSTAARGRGSATR